MSIDLNADLGESFGIHVVGDDEALMPVITSANVAAGFHGGDPSVLRRTVRLAARHRVAVGAHPSFPDLVGFGRREMQLSDWEVEDAVLYQIASVAGIAKAEGVIMRHVKPHGALYNMAAKRDDLAAAVARAVSAYDRQLTLFVPPASAMERAARAAGLKVALEGFADRAYDRAGRLVSRDVPGAVLHDDEAAARQAVRLAVQGEVVSIDGEALSMRVDTICVHGDAPGAAARAARIRAALIQAGVTLASPGAG